VSELLRSNDPVLISAVESLLRAAGFHPYIADQHMSVLDGSLGILPRRLLVPADDAAAARRLLTEAGFGAELRPA
jgi:Putative prokaryotic signal transducing protein